MIRFKIQKKLYDCFSKSKNRSKNHFKLTLSGFGGIESLYLQVKGVICEGRPDIVYCLSHRDPQNSLLKHLIFLNNMLTIFWTLNGPLRSSTGQRSDQGGSTWYTFLFISPKSTKFTIETCCSFNFFWTFTLSDSPQYN